MKKIFLVSVLVLLVFGLVWAATLYQLPPATTISVNEWSNHKVLTSTCPNTIMIPTNTAGEWTNFLNNRPACVTAVNFCGGYQYAGFCWYLSAGGENCNQACSLRNGYNDATRTVAGSEGTTTNCDSIIDGIRGGNLGTYLIIEITSPVGVGCTGGSDPKTGLYRKNRVTSITTNSFDATGPAGSRICACNN